MAIPGIKNGHPGIMGINNPMMPIMTKMPPIIRRINIKMGRYMGTDSFRQA
jgi:hypothetical protein